MTIDAAKTGAAAARRIEMIDPHTADAAQSAVIARLGAGRGRIPGPFNVWLHSPAIASGLERIGTHVDASPNLPPRDAEVVMLATALHWRAHYPITNHLRHAAKEGVPAQVIHALYHGARVQGQEPRLQAICDLTQDLLAREDIDDARFEGYVDSLGRATIAEVLATIGYFSAVSLCFKLHDVQPAAHQIGPLP